MQRLCPANLSCDRDNRAPTWSQLLGLGPPPVHFNHWHIKFFLLMTGMLISLTVLSLATPPLPRTLCQNTHGYLFTSVDQSLGRETSHLEHQRHRPSDPGISSMDSRASITGCSCTQSWTKNSPYVTSLASFSGYSSWLSDYTFLLRDLFQLSLQWTLHQSPWEIGHSCSSRRPSNWSLPVFEWVIIPIFI
jgi:hypothetical protein